MDRSGAALRILVGARPQIVCVLSRLVIAVVPIVPAPVALWRLGTRI